MPNEEINKTKAEGLNEFQKTNVFGEREKNKPEKEILSKESELVREEIRRELELMESDETLKKEAETKTQKIQYLGEEEKIKNLLKIANEKGIAFAIKVAKNMNDPYILDLLHDTLAREGYYKKFKN